MREDLTRLFALTDYNNYHCFEHFGITNGGKLKVNRKVSFRDRRVADFRLIPYSKLGTSQPFTPNQLRPPIEKYRAVAHLLSCYLEC